MAEINQVGFSKKEILILMLKDREIHDGHWTIGANLTFSALNISLQPDGSDVSPAGIVALAGLILERLPESTPFSVNAAEANPKQ